MNEIKRKQVRIKCKENELERLIKVLKVKDLSKIEIYRIYEDIKEEKIEVIWGVCKATKERIQKNKKEKFVQIRTKMKE